MTLMHYAVIRYNARLFNFQQWQSELEPIDAYTNYIPGWLLFKKMSCDFFLSSTDPDISKLFSSLTHYFQDQKNQFLGNNARKVLGVKLLEHYKLLLDSSFYTELRGQLVTIFNENIELFRQRGLKTKMEQQCAKENLIPLFVVSELYNVDSLRKKIKAEDIDLITTIDALIRTQIHMDYSIYYCTYSLMYANNGGRAEGAFHLYRHEFGYYCLQTSFNGNSFGKDLLKMTEEGKNTSSWQHAMGYGMGYMDEIACGNGSNRTLSRDILEPLYHDVVKPHPNSNQIRLRSTSTFRQKELMDLRTALPLQAMQTIDFFTRHMDLLESRDYQFYMLFSLFQPTILDLALSHNADIVTATQSLYQQGIALGDLAQSASQLSLRGLFLLKLTVWIYGYIVSCKTASDVMQSAARKAFAKIELEIHFWLKHDTQQVIQTELQRLTFYTIMKCYSPADLSLPQNRAQLIRALYARFYMQQHSQDRVPGSITQTEDESFTPLLFLMEDINVTAMATALPLVIEQLLPNQAPFHLQNALEPQLSRMILYCTDRYDEMLVINLMDGDISKENQEFIPIPTAECSNHSAFETIIGCDVNPLARLINPHEYLFQWQGETYYLAPQGFFKQIHSQWYQYVTDSFLPRYLANESYYAWVNKTGNHALVMQFNKLGLDKLVYHWQEGRLYSHSPAGQVCFDSEIRETILSNFASFEDSSFIEIILLDPPEQEQYVFSLPRYQLRGSFDKQQGVTLDYNDKLYYIMPEISPLETGILISESKTNTLNCLILIPVQPFYTLKTISGGHYQLIHDISNNTQPDSTLNHQAFVTLQFDPMGKLVTKTADSPDLLYLVYLNSARYDYDKALALLKTYCFQGNLAEITYLYWLCLKMPAQLDKHNSYGVEPIVNAKLLTIQLTALAKFAHVQACLKSELTGDESLDDFLFELPFYIIKSYTNYHRLCNNISDQLRIPQSELNYLARYVWLNLESRKRTAQQKITLLENKLSINSKAKNLALQKKVKLQQQIVIKCEMHQKTGYLSFIHAKTEYFEQKTIEFPFCIPETTLYTHLSLIPYWPKKNEAQYHPLNSKVSILNKSEDSVMKPGKFYLECRIDDTITYHFLDNLGEPQSITIWTLNLEDITLGKNKPLSAQQLKALKEPVLQHAAKSGNTLSITGTLADLQQLTHEPTLNTIFQKACEQLTLDLSNDSLFVNLKFFMLLILDQQSINDGHRVKLIDFCQRTIISCVDLNNHLRNESSHKFLDSRNDRLQIAIVLLRGLQQRGLFSETYAKIIKKHSYRPSDLEKYPIWSIISDDKDGFYAQFSSDMPAISFYGPVNGYDRILVKKEKRIQLRPLATICDDNTKNHMKPVELPFSMMRVSEELTAFTQQLHSLKREIIEHYKTLMPSVQRQHFDETDRALDALEIDYRSAILLTIERFITIETNVEDIKHTLVRFTEDIVDSHSMLKRFSALLPLDMQALLALQIKELGAKQLPIQIDELLIEYAQGMSASFLDLRQLPQEFQHLVLNAAEKFLHRVFLYRQWSRILVLLVQLNKSAALHNPDEQYIELAKLILGLQPIKGNIALDLFQYQTNKTVRPDQWALIERLLPQWDRRTRNRIGQLRMGAGKSKVILPILAFLKADGYHLATIEVPAALLQTSYNDLRKTAKSVFNQEIESFSFERNSPADAVSLMHYLAKFRTIIQQKKCLMMAASSLQSLHLKWRELLYQAQSAGEDSEIFEQIDVLSDILTLFQERADVVIDEVHKVLDINLELNYSIGQQTSLDPTVVATTLDLYDFLENLTIDAAGGCLAKLNGLSFSEILINPELLNHPPELTPALIAYCSERYNAQHDYDDHPEKLTIEALLRAQWNVFLPLTLKQKLREQYGPSPQQDITIAVPYAANNVPTKNLFANFLESINYTTQMCKIEGIQFGTFKTVLQSWKKSDQEYLMCNTDECSEAENRYQICLQSIDNLEDVPTHLHRIDVGNDDQLQAIYPQFKMNKPFIRYALEEAILPSVQLYRKKLTSNAINHANQVKYIQGLTGTPENYPTFDNRLSFDMATSFGTKNYLKTLLKTKQIPLLLQGEEQLSKLSAIIDVGAHRRGQSNIQVAEELATRLNHSSIRYILFFHDDQLCAWAVGGSEQNIIVLPSTDPDKIVQCLKVPPEQCFSYYDQSHATGIDLPQPAKACAAVSVDITTTLSNFLQAVARMRSLHAGQTIQIFLSPALNEKLGNQPTLDNLYECLEQTEKNKLANDVFKAACKKIYNVVQMDLDKRLMQSSARDSCYLFKKFARILVDRNSDDIIELYGSEITVQQTAVILNEMLESVLNQWRIATSNDDIDLDLRSKCTVIIEDALNYCNETQQTTLELGTEVSIEQQQQVQIELKMEVKIEIIDEMLQPNPIDTKWIEALHIKENGRLSGDPSSRAQLSRLWHNHPTYTTKFTGVVWSDDLWLSTQYYRTHEQQPLNRLSTDLALKPIFSTLFWRHNNEVRALITCQEEAEIIAKILSESEQLRTNDGDVWLETVNGLILAGTKPSEIKNNASYRILKEQIYTLDGEAPLLANKKDLLWFSGSHIHLLQNQMLQQGKMDYSTTLKQLEKRFSITLLSDDAIISDNDLTLVEMEIIEEPPVDLEPVNNKVDEGKNEIEIEIEIEIDNVVVSPLQIEIKVEVEDNKASATEITEETLTVLASNSENVEGLQDDESTIPVSTRKRLDNSEAIECYRTSRQNFEDSIELLERDNIKQSHQTRNALCEAKRLLKAVDKLWFQNAIGLSNLNKPLLETNLNLLLTITEIISRAALALNFSTTNEASLNSNLIRYYPDSQSGYLIEELPIIYTIEMHKLNIAYLIVQAETLKGNGIPWLRNVGLALGLLAGCILVAGGILAVIPSGGTSLLAVVASLVGINALLVLGGSTGIMGIGGIAAFILGKETALVSSLRTTTGGLPKKELTVSKQKLMTLERNSDSNPSLNSEATFFRKKLLHKGNLPAKETKIMR